MSNVQVSGVVRLLIGVAVVAGAIAGLDLVWAADSPPASVSPLGIELIGPREWLSDSTGALRVIVTDHASGAPASRARITISLKPTGGDHPQVLASGRADRLGTLNAGFEIPDLEPGGYELKVSAQWRNLSDETTQAITLKRSTQILLTTDKPIYQPGQVIHLRALALKRPILAAAGDQDVTLEVSDAKGNKVYKQPLKSNHFGIAAADFQLADEVNMGRYTLRALIGEDQAEKTVTVSRYVLPKFKVALSTDRGYYLPGEKVEGKVQADYFFGKPVSGGKVAISVKTFDVEFTEIQKIEGQTDENGTFKFECKLPEHFVGQPLEQGKAFLQFEAKLTDQAQHTEQAMQTSSVAASRLNINAVAEGGSLTPGLVNTVFVMTSLPTGEPVQATVQVEGAETGNFAVRITQRSFKTDDLGIAEVPLDLSETGLIPRPPGMGAAPAAAPGGVIAGGGMPGGLRARPVRPPRGGGMGQRPEGPPLTLVLTAKMADGTEARKVIVLTSKPGGADNLLLRVDKPLAKVGDVINATALCSSPGGAVYFDLIKDRQTMLTQAADIQEGKAQTAIRLSPELAGTVYLSAYRINPDGQTVRDTRPLFVQSADDLRIGITADRDTYLPGGEAKLVFAVTDPKGRPVASALGINVVDESVFALQELQPGMEKVFFYLEQELMKPRYEIHGFELPTMISKDLEAEPAAQQSDAQRAAKVVFASVEAPDFNSFQVDTYAARLQAAKEQWTKALSPKVQAIQAAIQAYQEKKKSYPPYKKGVEALISGGFLKKDQLKDLWGRDLIIEPYTYDGKVMNAALIKCLGPDGKPGTDDDFVVATWNPERWFKDDREAGERVMEAMPMAMAAPGGAMGGMGGGGGMARGARDGANGAAAADHAASAAKPSVRVREFFPETMFVEPSLITDENGKATLTIPMADSITTWRLAAMANSAVGQLGSTTKGLRCFQDFFVDIDLPVSLTQNDQVSIPVAVYNYLPGKQTVRLELAQGDWFELQGDAVQSLEIAPNDVDVRYFTLKVKQIGNHPLTVHAYGSKMDDAIKRSIEVTPDGKQVETTANGRLKGAVEETVTIPEGAVAGASNILVKVYPGIFSQVVEGLDSVLQMPFGCFEQTSSATWPNIMVMDYMKSTKQITPEIQMKAEGFINTGYQRMVAYEVPGGGFSWFGAAPANKLLTAYGLMEFYDMSAVHSVDPAIITRTQQWLLGQADDRGVYKPEKEYYHAETWGKVQVDELLPTSYVLWGLTHTDCKDPRIEKSAAFVRDNWQKAKEPYTLSIVANGLVGVDAVLHNGELSAITRDVLDALLKMAKTEKDQMWWASEVSGITNSTGKSADLEATGMACIALMRAGLYSGEVSKVLNYLIAAKDPHGTWYSSNATMLALRALTMAQKTSTSKVNGEVTVSVNGQQASGFALTPQDADVVRVIDCKKLIKPGENKVRIQFAGEGSTLYQIVGRYYMPWKGVEKPGVEPLSIDLKYDKTTLAKDDTITANVTVRNNTPAMTSMIIVDLGIPPGFSIDAGDFSELVGSKKIDRFNMTGRQVIVYIEKMTPRQEISFSYSLKAKFPLKAKTPKSTVYEYYNPDNRSDAKPVEMVVGG